MKFTNNLRQLPENVLRLKKQFITDEFTKASRIMPFIQQVLGYDLLNPQEIVPESIIILGRI